MMRLLWKTGMEKALHYQQAFLTLGRKAVRTTLLLVDANILYRTKESVVTNLEVEYVFNVTTSQLDLQKHFMFPARRKILLPTICDDPENHGSSDELVLHALSGRT